MDAPLYRCWTKVTTSEFGEPRHSLNWALSRRAWLRVYSDRVECGDWTIPFDSVTETTVYRVRQWFIPATVLELRTKDRCFQFGFNPWANPLKSLPLEFEEKRVRLRYSPFSIAVRIVLAVLLVYLLWKWLFNR